MPTQPNTHTHQADNSAPSPLLAIHDQQNHPSKVEAVLHLCGSCLDKTWQLTAPILTSNFLEVATTHRSNVHVRPTCLLCWSFVDLIWWWTFKVNMFVVISYACLMLIGNFALCNCKFLFVCWLAIFRLKAPLQCCEDSGKHEWVHPRQQQQNGLSL